MSSASRRPWLSAALVLASAATPAVAQVTVDPKPQPALPVIAPVVAPLVEKGLPLLVFDARGSYPALGRDEVTARGLAVQALNLPTRARALVVAAHAYPVRRGRLKLGIGLEMLRGSGSSQTKGADGVATGPKIHRHLSAVTGQVSLNFGRGAGWSYLTAGAGPLKFESYLNEAERDGVGATTLNFGGGARWFNWDHAAFTVDLRFYMTRPATATTNTAARNAARIVLFSAGISIK